MDYRAWKGSRKNELEDFAISFLVLVLLFSNFDPRQLPYALVAVLTAFLSHELAHRQVARRYGYKAYYKRWDTGIMIALLFGLLTRVLTGSTWIFAALGAVYIYTPYQYWEDKEAYGKISLAGPATNIAVGFLSLLILKSLYLSPFAWRVLWTTVVVNLWLAFFNLLPFPPLDGYNVTRWNTGVWAASIGLAYLLYRLP
ncbi:site-2 protease family protein [Thermococcus pacificus]|uniref:Metalloprotease n=1 Tax=Thermococcus pacificus TaxID=71998 RepID=A0A218P7K9_9EURY|nr:metalloprotease [Thermococcus pacificus]ASJ06752.1 metalloprotease [Thermococcus pacificus]